MAFSVQPGSSTRAGPARGHYAIYLLLLLFLGLAATYSIVVPPFETPDEIWHFAFIQHLAEGKGLPVSEPNSQALWRQQGVQAPGYYLAAAALTAAIDQRDFAAIYDRANPHRALGRPDTQINRNYLIHYPSEDWPWQGSILALHVARFFSVVLGAVTVYATYRTLALLLGGPAALLGAAFVASIPQFVFISAAASNDNAINASAALVLWQLVALVIGGDEAQDAATHTQRSQTATTFRPDFPSRTRLFLLGLSLGLALLSKLSGLALVGLAGLVVLVLAWWQRSWRLLLDAALWTGLPALVVAGWWYLRNWLLYGDLLAWNVWQANILLRVIPANWATMAGELGSLERSFWGLFGWLNLPYPEWIYTQLRVGEFLIGGGLLLWLGSQFLAGSHRRRGRVGAAGVLLLWLVLLTISWLRFMRIAPAAQGRYFFPAAPALGLLFVLAWRGYGQLIDRFAPGPAAFAVQSDAGGRGLGWVMVAGLGALAVATPFWILQPAYRPPALQRASADPSRALATLGQGSEDGEAGRFAVLQAAAVPEKLLPGQTATVTITWQALAPTTIDYSVFLHLEDPAELTVAQLDTMPGGGLAPTSQWQPNQKLTERYRVTIPATAYTPNQGHWVVGLYDQQSGERLPVQAASEGGQDDGFAFGTVRIEPPPGDLPNPIGADFADNVTLAGYQFSQRILRPGDTLTVTLYWRARGPITQEYTTFVHLLDRDFQMHGGHDGGPQPPTVAWPVGRVISDVHKLTVSPDAPPGRYQLEIGLYPWPDFSRLRLLEASGAEGADRLLLGPLRIAR